MHKPTNHVMTCKQYIKTQTRLIRIHMTCGGFYCSTELIVLVSQPPYTRLALNGFQASCYFHHSSQYILRETKWLFRASGCNPYPESLLNYIDGAPPW